MPYIDVDTAVELFVNMLPLTSDSDFKTIDTGVAYNETGMDLVWNFITSAGVVSQTAITPTSGGSYDWTHVGDGMYKIELPASGGASANNNTEGTGWFTGKATGVLAWKSPEYIFRAAALNDALVDGGDLLDVNVTQFGGTNGTFASGLPHVKLGDVVHGGNSATLTLDTLTVLDTVTLPSVSIGGSLTVTGAVTATNGSNDFRGVVPTTASKTGYALSSTGMDAVTLPANLITATSITNDAITAAKIADGAIDAATFAAGAITASAIATDAIDNDAIAANAVTEIQSGLATAATLSTVATNVSAIKSAMILAEGTNGSTGNDTTHIHLPSLPYGDDEINDHALVIFDDSESEYHVCWITDWVNATKLATVTTLPFTPQNASDSYALLALKRNVRSDVTAAAIADQVWEETLADHSGTSGSTAAALNAAGSAGDPWSTALPGAYGAGTAGKIIGDNINATVSSRSSHSASDVWAVGTRALTDKAGFTISGTTTTFDALQTSLNSAHGSGSWATATGFSTHSAADVWAVGTRTLTAGTNIQLPSNGLANVTAWTVALTGNLSGSVGSVTAGVNLADGAITDAKFTIPSLTGPASGPVGMLVQLWRRFFKKVTRDSDEIKTYADNGSTVVTTQTYTASGSDEDVGAAS